MSPKRVVTATDRETAINVLASARADDMWRTDKAIELLERIAVALAEERAKARAPFLKLADRWADEQRAHKDYWVRGDAAANAIRYEAEKPE